MSDIKVETEFVRILKKNQEEGDCKLIFFFFLHFIIIK